MSQPTRLALLLAAAAGLGGCPERMAVPPQEGAPTSVAPPEVGPLDLSSHGLPFTLQMPPTSSVSAAAADEREASEGTTSLLVVTGPQFKVVVSALDGRGRAELLKTLGEGVVEGEGQLESHRWLAFKSGTGKTSYLGWSERVGASCRIDDLSRSLLKDAHKICGSIARR